MHVLYWISSYLFDWAKIYLLLFLCLNISHRSKRTMWIVSSIGLLAIALYTLFGDLAYVAPVMAVTAILTNALTMQTKFYAKGKALFLWFAPLACFVAYSALEVALAGLLYGLLGISIDTYTEEYLLNTTIHALTITIILVIAFVIRKRCRTKPQTLEWDAVGPTTSGIVVISVIGLFFHLMFLVPAQDAVLSTFKDGSLQMLIGVTVSTVILLVFLLVVTAINEHRKLLQMDKKLAEDLLEQKMKYDEVDHQKQEIIFKLHHDIRSDVISIREQILDGDTGAALACIEDILGTVSRSSLIRTGNNLVDANVNYILDEKIHVNWTGKIPHNIKMPARELCLLFANLAKNAAAAALKTPEPHVTVSLKTSNTSLHIEFCNTVEGPVPLEKNLPSRKGGRGMAIIDRIARSYHGIVKCSNMEDDWFSTQVYLPNIVPHSASGK